MAFRRARYMRASSVDVTLRRSVADSWIAGVCGGIGRLTGVEGWIWRMLFVLGLLFGGLTIFVYVVLWIFVPREEL